MVQPPGAADAHACRVRAHRRRAEQRRLLDRPHRRRSSYSPDGRLIAFDAGGGSPSISTSGGQVTLLPAASDDDGNPAFVARRPEQIAFTATNDRGGTDILMRRVDGRGEVAPRSSYDATEPAWSARGDLAYVRDGNIYLRPRGNPHRRFVTSGISPDWSPDGKRLVIVRPRPNLVFAAPYRTHLHGPAGRSRAAAGRRREHVRRTPGLVARRALGRLRRPGPGRLREARWARARGPRDRAHAAQRRERLHRRRISPAWRPRPRRLV